MQLSYSQSFELSMSNLSLALGIDKIKNLIQKLKTPKQRDFLNIREGGDEGDSV